MYIYFWFNSFKYWLNISFFFNKVQLEIDERRNFLSEMEKHGQGAKFRPLIETEISQVRPRNWNG